MSAVSRGRFSLAQMNHAEGNGRHKPSHVQVSPQCRHNIPRVDSQNSSSEVLSYPQVTSDGLVCGKLTRNAVPPVSLVLSTSLAVVSVFHKARTGSLVDMQCYMVSTNRPVSHPNNQPDNHLLLLDNSRLLRRVDT
jgi:hypothetical protein